MQQATLLPGDYVLTEDMNKQQYHAVAQAFMNAGARKGEYPSAIYLKQYAAIGWNTIYDAVWHQDSAFFETMSGRQLTIDQVLNATNAGKETDMHITDKLTQARDELDKAQARYEATLEEHRAAYPWPIIDEREDQPTEDMSDPANWWVGDKLEYSPQRNRPYLLTVGRIYAIEGFDLEGTPWVRGDDFYLYTIILEDFRFHSRPARAYKLTTTD